MPAPLDVSVGHAEPNAALTPKGRMVAELRIWREPGEVERYLADVPRAAAAPLLEHLGRYLPPRFATFADISDELGMLTVMGPRAAELLAGAGMGIDTAPGVFAALAEDELRVVRRGQGGESDVTVIRSGAVATPAWDVVADRETIRDLWRRARAAGALPVGSGVWEALRLEAGRPAFGADMDTDTLMPETGLVARLVDHAKGCYTGQEVIVRIRDRGHVNRHLRRLRLSDAPTPAAGTELWAEGNARPVGHITSSAVSPRMGTLALAYVRREVEPGGSVAVAAPDGPPAVVEAI
jgi:folate-binding protein YgfZ